MGSQPISIQLGRSCRKFCRKSCGKFYGKPCRKCSWKFCGKCCGKSCRKCCGKSCRKCCGKFCRKSCVKFTIPIPKPFLKVIFKICNSSRSSSFLLVNVKNSFLKPILNRFSHMIHQIKASSTRKKCFCKVLLPLRGLKMAKNVCIFLPFLSPLQAIKHYLTIFSCRGGSKV